MEMINQASGIYHKITSSVCKDERGCWIWMKAKNPKGYGKIGIRLNGKDKTYLAHRLSYLIYRGEIPHGKLVMHSCDVPSCCNPDHLSLGTPLDNTRDMIRKGRDSFSNPMWGINHGMYKHGFYCKEFT